MGRSENDSYVTPFPRFEVIFWARGEVKKIDTARGEFRASLVDETGKRSTATISVADVDPSERAYVVVGNFFAFTVCREYRRTGLRTSERIVFEPVRVWTERDEEAVRGLEKDDQAEGRGGYVTPEESR